MAIVKEFISENEDGTKLYKRYSDQGFLLLQVETGIHYGEAIDVDTSEYTYEETNILVIDENETLEE